MSEGRLPIANADGNGRDIIVNRYIVQKGLERQLVLYWYQSHGRVVASEYWSKLYLVTDAIRTNRTDGSMVRVIAPIAHGDESGAAAERVAEDFVRAILPALPAYLPEETSRSPSASPPQKEQYVRRASLLGNRTRMRC